MAFEYWAEELPRWCSPWPWPALAACSNWTVSRWSVVVVVVVCWLWVTFDDRSDGLLVASAIAEDGASRSPAPPRGVRLVEWSGVGPWEREELEAWAGE